MKNTLIWIVVLVILGAGVYWVVTQPNEEMPALEEGQEQVMSEAVTVSLSEQSDSGMSGQATLTEVDGGTRVVLDLSGAPEEMAQPAHIHAGSCADIGGIVYPLESPVNGVSETMLDASLDEILDQLPLALNVHKSPEEISVYVACGDIVL